MSYAYNQGPYTGQPGYPPPQGAYPPPQGGYNPQPGAYPPPPPPQGGYPSGAYPSAPQPGFQPPPYSNDPYGNQGDNGGETKVEMPDVPLGFNDKTIRRGFIRKVFALLGVQIGLTIAFIAPFAYIKVLRHFVYFNALFVLIGAAVAMLTLLIILSCSNTLRRKSPHNYIMLFLFTLSTSVMLSIVVAVSRPDEVWIAMGATAAICFGLALFACQTKYDFTMCGGSLFAMLWCLMLFGFVAAIVRSQYLILLYLFLGVLLFSIYLVFDMQMIIGGGHRFQFSPEEYIFAVIVIYLDIINIFLRILQILRYIR